jgi:trans-aconitate 2-methyltransferase
MTPSATSSQQWNAALYQSNHAFVFHLGQDVLALLDPKPGESILDLGCGTGELTARIAESGAQVIGLDASPEMIAQARRQFPALDFQVADATTFTLPEPVDAVFSNAALHWIPQADAAAHRIRAALKPGGRFAAEFGGHGNIAAIEAAAAAAAEQLQLQPPANPWYFPTLGAYAGLLERQGFRVTFAAHFDRPTPLKGPDGLRQWITMFMPHVLAVVPETQREQFLDIAENHARPALYRDGAWQADYVRLRVTARAAG